MAIDKGQLTRTFTIKDRTWRIQMDCVEGKPPAIEIFRERCETCIEDGTIRTTVDPNPIRLSPQDLPGLAPFFSVPSELLTLIPDEATAVKILTIIPALLAIACDSADKKRIQETGT